MKNHILSFTFMLLCASLAEASDLFNLPDGNFEIMPARGMQVYEPPATKGQAEISISSDEPAQGSGSLRVACGDGVYASISFPMSGSMTNAKISAFLRGDLAEAENITIGVQSFTMEGGFKSISVQPVIDAKNKIGAAWDRYYFDIKRDPAATHWQMSFILKGPGTLWIDQLERVQP